MLKRFCSMILMSVAVAMLLAACGDTHDHEAEAAAAEANLLGPAADFTLKDLQGNEVTLSEYKGQVVVLNFWATWCIPCKVEMPWFVEFQKKYKDQGFTVLAVSLDDEMELVQPFVDEYELNFPVMWGSDEIADKFGGIIALPTTLIIDREGNIVDSHTGLVSKSVYEDKIAELL